MSEQAIARSVYVGQIRRAFLMRAHPDRFRLQPDGVRQRQATLLSALSERMDSKDFRDYASNSPLQQSYVPRQGSRLQYFLERRDGSLANEMLDLSRSPFDILESMANALKNSGVSQAPPPPPATTADPNGPSSANYDITWATDRPTNVGIDHSFDKNSNKGRDIIAFLKNVDLNEIRERKKYRMDVSAAALMVRRAYSFQAVDGIRLGWSSKSFAKLLKSLIDLHEEHNDRFCVDSFYPLRLVFSRDEVDEPLDLFDGILYLHPAATQTQWLDVLMSVTEDKLQEYQRNRRLLQESLQAIQGALEIKLRKGHTCRSVEYHSFVGELASDFRDFAVSPSTQSSSLMRQPIPVTIESSLNVRRSKVTNGGLQIPSKMTSAELVVAVNKLSSSARQDLDKQQQLETGCSEAIHQMQWKFGLQKVRRKGMVSKEHFLDALGRLLKKNNLPEWLSGHSLGISGRGQFCHLDDDGSIVVPCDFR